MEPNTPDKRPHVMIDPTHLSSADLGRVIEFRDANGWMWGGRMTSVRHYAAAGSPEIHTELSADGITPVPVADGSRVKVILR